MAGDGSVNEVADAMRTTLSVGSVAGPPLADGEYVRARTAAHAHRGRRRILQHPGDPL